MSKGWHLAAAAAEQCVMAMAALSAVCDHLANPDVQPFAALWDEEARDAWSSQTRRDAQAAAAREIAKAGQAAAELAAFVESMPPEEN
jgi:hypothetical protein